MKRLTTALVLVVLSCAGVCSAALVDRITEDEIHVSISFTLSEFALDNVEGYTYIRGSDLVYLPQVGTPGLPRKSLRLSIPWDTKAASIEARVLSETALDGVYRIVPTQPPVVLGQAQAEWVDGREDIYSRNEPYPHELVGGVHQGFMGDSRILSFHLSPFRWNPTTGELLLCEEIEVKIRLEPSRVVRPVRRRPAGSRTLGRMVEQIVANPEDIATFSAQPGAMPGAGLSLLEDGEYEYVIITADSLVSTYEPLIAWKNQKGVPARCVTVEWIDATYSGEDIQAKARSFITDAYETWGTVWVLLGGDGNIIPSRVAWAMDCEMGGPSGNRIRCDLYFGDLDGTWNANGTSPYGEVADSVDMYPEVFVGRAPAENIAEALVFVDKVLTYEKNPPADYALDMLMAGEIMWTDPYTDGGVGLDMIDDDCVPPRFDPILKLYESLGNESAETVLAAMSAGQNFILHDGHCSEYVMGAGEGYIWYTDADTVSNGDRTFILNSIGCWPAAIDKDCIAERFVNNPNGGCVAFIGNSRYGWGSPGNPGFGYSDKFQYQFARAVFVDEIFPLGQAHAQSKTVFVNFAGDENVYRWNEYQLNLLGDPEMPVWTDEPASLLLTAPDSVMGAGDVVTVVVEDAAGVVEGALVCATNGLDVYSRARTDMSGTVTLTVTTVNPDSLLLTATAPNHLPAQQRIAVVTQGTLLAWTAVAVADGGDGKANPGETAQVQVTIKNFGTQPDSGVWATLRAADGLSTVTDSTAYYGEIGAGSEVTGTAFTVEFDSLIANGDAAVFDLIIRDSTSTEWTSRVPIPVASPVLRVMSYGIDDRLGGDGDWVVEPGETVLVTLEVANSGLTYAEADVYLASLDPQLEAEDSVTSTGQIGSGGAGYSMHRVAVAAVCPGTHSGMLGVSITSSEGYTFTDTVHFSVGDLAFTDNCESGEGDWVHTGSPDLWHLSSHRSHSDSVSWYFGNESTHTYPSGADGSVVSRDFVAGENSRLSFWFWYDFTTYGTDGAYVIVLTNGVADTLDFIGSGGALGDYPSGALNIYSSWTKWDCLLADVDPGDTVQIEFGFISDNTDVAEGIYIDDISFTCETPVLTGIDDIPATASDVVFEVFPNPAHTMLTFAFRDGRRELGIDFYTVEGRLAATIKKPSGRHSVSWDLKDSSGDRVAPGIYLARIRGNTYPCSRKIVVLR